MKVRSFLVLMLALGCAGGVDAAAPADPGALADAAIVRFVQPRFQALQATATAQAQAWDGFCTKRSAAGVAKLKTSFGATADAWAQVDFVRMGPATTQMRTERFNYWIDRSGAAGKALSALLAAPDESGLTPAAVKASSAAAQGLPVLERLLFDEGAGDKLLASGPDGERRCAVGRAIALNLAAMAQDLATDWNGPEGVAQAVKADKPWGVYFANRKEAASVLLTDLVIGLEGLKDNETAMIFHDEANSAGVRLAEQWRSGRSLRDVKLKYAALKQAFDPFLGGADAKTKAQLDNAFKDTDVKLAALEAAISAAPAHSPQRTAALGAVLGSMTTLVETIMPAAPLISGVPLGFNSLDGD